MMRHDILKKQKGVFMAKPIMIQGVCSGAGKSLIAAALCRIFRQDGFSVAPFKAQNMALNSFVTRDGLEMGRAQAVQAEAAGIEPDVRMNPILLKPTSDSGSQVIINGVPHGTHSARDYWGNKKMLAPVVEAAYQSLAAEYDIIVIEGAGSPAEINLNKDDIVNMGAAKMAGAPVLLVGDIDRGGVFASLYGTVKLLSYDEQELIRGLIINKFRGDMGILDPGLTMLEALTGKKVAGVIPYVPLDIDDEDSVSDRLEVSVASGMVNIAVVRLPWLSNFTDFLSLSRIPGVSVYYARKPVQLEGADMVLLPGTKNTMDDLKWLRSSGMEEKIRMLHAGGTIVFGICGGYQMMGESVSDPESMEGGGSLRGMGLLPVDTVFRKEKTTVQTEGMICCLEGPMGALSGMHTIGYEIHMGETMRRDGAKPFQILCHGGTAKPDGCHKNNAYGTYQHGIFDQGDITEKLVSILARRKGVVLETEARDPAVYREKQYDKLADTVREALDMEFIYHILGETEND